MAIFGLKRTRISSGAITIGLVLIFAAVIATVVAFRPQLPWQSAGVMLILRGVASTEKPRGQLDDSSALEYARELGYRGEVLDVAGNTGGSSPQVEMALDRIRNDPNVKALYGFSGGGYNARTIWKQLSAEERQRIGKVVVIGSPGVHESDFAGSGDVTVKQDPPEGHMAGPKELLKSVENE